MKIISLGSVKFIVFFLILGTVLLCAGSAVYFQVHQLALFSASANDDIARTKKVLFAYLDFNQERLLGSLGLNKKNGEYVLLDEHLDITRYHDVEPKSGPVLVRNTFGPGADARCPIIPTATNYEIRGEVVHFPIVSKGMLRVDCGLDIPLSSVHGFEFKIRLPRVSQWSTVNIRLSDIPNAPVNDAELPEIYFSTAVARDGEMHTYQIPFTSQLDFFENGVPAIATILLEIEGPTEGDAEIEYLRVISKAEQFSANPYGRDYAAVGSETRPMVFMKSPSTLEFPVSVPNAAPLFRAGLAGIDSATPIEFSLSVRGLRGEEIVFKRNLGADDAWMDIEASLSAWAGQKVTLILRVDSPEQTVALWSSPKIETPAREMFNVIVVLEDALRADRLSGYGYATDTSPVKDAFARDGVLFENAFSQATKTRPSVPSLFTSLYPTATGVWWFWESLGDNYLTLAEVLRSQGFETAAFIQNPNAGPAAGLHQGFDRNFFAGKAGDFGPGKIYGHKVYDWIKQNKDRNFFLYLHVVDPHGPYSPPEPFDAWYRNSGGGSTPVIYNDSWDPEWISAPTKEGRRALYDGEVRHNDMLFESLVQTLRDLSIFEDTLIIFLSDHGENLGERGQWGHQPPGFTQGVRVPLIMHYPNGLPKGKRISAPAQILDVMPTILELAGISSEKIPLQGRSLMPRIDGPPSGIFDMPLVWIDEVTRYTVKTIETSSQKLLVGGELFGSVVFGDWHIMITVPPAPNRLVFNYANDPQEEDDRFSRLMQWYIDDFVEPVMRKHQDLSMAIFESMSAGAELKEIILTPESEKILRALGYIE